MPTVFTIGEALIDFMPDRKGVGLKDVESFSKAAGGAPANVACAVARLGGTGAFIGKLGADAFGDFLVETMEAAGADVSRVLRTTEANTALAFVSLQEDGNREFSFYRNPSADMLLREEEIGDWFSSGDLLHFGSVDLIEAPVKYAHLAAIRKAREAGALISFDPNVRLPLWQNPEDCRRAILEFLPLSRLVKISDEELAFITGIEDEQEGIASLFTGDVEHVIYTRGAAGADWYSRSFTASVPGHKVQSVDTTGAGDSFIGALLHHLHLHPGGLDGIDREKAAGMLAFANAAAALTTTRPGAIPALPGWREVRAFMEESDRT
ncbi:carbohydrate kinase [Paenibacillus sambharensis]|uniref:Carbohydrate kinase n=1 Tax=Paenibacillus sambharensis TaxID=1803190 RepID=A0A2W1KZ84_9BACL|nr:PfkB family carbohydrate kinase [Paenibacillus sambharensis]PZD92978.1 carbohydrate kinase [Paenibacillus sambharensis]